MEKKVSNKVLNLRTQMNAKKESVNTWNDALRVQIYATYCSMVRNEIADQITPNKYYIKYFEEKEYIESITINGKLGEDDIIINTPTRALLLESLDFAQLFRLHEILLDICVENSVEVDKYVDVHTDYYDSVDEKYYVDAYISNYDEDSGEIVATITPNGDVTWIVDEARYSKLVNQSISILLDKLKIKE